MKFKNILNSVLIIILGLVSISPVYAYNILDTLFRPFSGVNIGSLYLQYFYFIDAIVYLILFLGLTQYVFGKVYKSADGKPAREAKIIAVGVGLALTFAMAMFELQTGFNLGRLSWYAALILYILLYFFLFSLLKGMFDDVKIAFCISNLIMYGVLYSTFHSLYYWIEYNIPLLMALLSIALVISFICVLLQLFKLFSGGGNGGRDGRDGAPGKDGTSGKDGEPGKSGGEGPPGKDAEIKPTPKIIIEAPPITHIREFKPTEPIPLVWRVENVTEPYHCFISTLPRLGAVIPVAEERGNNTHRYAIADLRNYGHKYNFPPTNEYGIFIHLLNNKNEPILDPNTENEVLAKVDITVVDKKTGEQPRVDISVPPHTPPGGTPPTFKSGEHIPLKFKTTNVQLPYPYLVHIFDAAKNPIGKLEGTSKDETVTVSNINLPTIVDHAPLPQGHYFIHVQVQDSKTGSTVEDIVEFIVADGTEPPPGKTLILEVEPTSVKKKNLSTDFRGRRNAELDKKKKSTDNNDTFTIYLKNHSKYKDLKLKITLYVMYQQKNKELVFFNKNQLKKWGFIAYTGKKHSNDTDLQINAPGNIVGENVGKFQEVKDIHIKYDINDVNFLPEQEHEIQQFFIFIDVIAIQDYGTAQAKGLAQKEAFYTIFIN